jgi:hypothetical protein
MRSRPDIGGHKVSPTVPVAPRTSGPDGRPACGRFCASSPGTRSSQSQRQYVPPDSIAVPPAYSSAARPLRELERETRELKMENEFLKKAAAYFAKDHR